MIKEAQQSFSFHQFGRLLVENRRKAGMYTLFFVIVSFNLGLFLPANMHNPAVGRMINAVQLGCFGIMGIVNVWFFYKTSFLSAFSFSGVKLAFISLLFIVICLVLFVYYYFSGNNGLVMAFASSSAFLLPFLIHQGWIEFMGIPEKQYGVWYMSPDAGVSLAAMPVPTVNTMQVQLTLFRRVSAAGQNTFPVTTSGKLKLGKVFERFVEEQRLNGEGAAIQLTNEQRQAFGWQFYEKKWGGLYSRNLNPSMSLLENGIKTNANILVTRVYENQV